MFNPDTAPSGGAYFLGSFEAAARSLAVESITARVRSDAEIEAEIASLGSDQTGLVLMPNSFMQVHQGTVISLTARNIVPAPTCLVSPGRAVCFHMEQTSRIFFAVRLAMLMAFWGERTRLTFRCRHRPNTS